DGKYLFVGGYHDGKITAVHTHKDGRLGKIFDGVFHKGIGSVAERNFRPHVSCVLPTPEGKYVCAVDNGIDQVKIYRINTTRNRLELVDVLRCKRESGPREIVFSKDGNYAYILFELINQVGVFKYKDNGKTPEFELVQTIETLSDELDPLHDCAAAITISPDGKHLFTSTAGDNSVAMFSINQEDGTLVKEFALPISGEYPKDIALFPDGKHIAVVNHESNSITTFTIDYEKKVLVMKGKPMKVETPNCILITKIEV
ncbi:MAG: beta-propeller fold lactonase family protein, partial [Oliverpabstia sp.]|nr:beta-propeller fold lactonase family protein [Oliverpabstia sp.]